MDRPHVLLHYERVFPYPVDVAYAWLTDYQDDDPARAGAIVAKRDVVRRAPDEVEVEGILDVLGQRTAGRATIKLFPAERRWVAIIGKGGWVFEYRLVPEGVAHARLLVDYRMGSRRWTRRALMRLAMPLLRRRIDVMWDGFASAMAREIAASPPAAR